jgi:hypothetical protein
VSTIRGPHLRINSGPKHKSCLAFLCIDIGSTGTSEQKHSCIYVARVGTRAGITNRTHTCRYVVQRYIIVCCKVSPGSNRCGIEAHA